MNFIDKLRIKRNPNIIDSFESDKLRYDMIRYAINCGYKFNPDTMENFVSFPNYVEKFRDEESVFNHFKQATLTDPSVESKRSFYAIYNNMNKELDKFVTRIKEDNELSENFAKELETWLNGCNYLEMQHIIEIIDGKDDLLDELLQNHLDTLQKNHAEFGQFIEHVVLNRTPQELYDKEIKNSSLEKAFINTLEPKNFFELFENFSEKDFKDYDDLIKSSVENNIEKFIPCLENLDELYNQKMHTSFITDSIKNKVVEYLKENNVLYDENIPKFALDDNQYVLQCVLQSPTILPKMGYLNKFTLTGLEKESEEIARKISEEQIKFEGIIPDEYLYNKSIFESIVSVNPELFRERKNSFYLEYITKGMSEQETLDYYKKIGVPFNKDTVFSKDNMLILLECLKNDYSTLPDDSKQYTKEEYQKIYEAIKDDIEPEEILSNEFLTRNPYFVNDLINSQVDLTNINLQETMYYDEFYLDLKAKAIKKGIDIPEPKNYNDIIKFKNNQACVFLDGLENIEKGMEYLQKKELDQDLLVVLRQEKFDEFTISDNIDFFEELAKKNININFKYDSGKEIFSLKNVLDKEHFMQHAVDDIKDKNFSPLEQLIAIYDITKIFKPYVHEKNSSAESRALYEYLENDYMVCSGYADLICNLGYRLNLNLYKSHLDLYKAEGHARNYVNLVDPKYGIDGYYVLEPTWEQNGRMGRTTYEQYKSTYKEFLLTTEEGRNNYTEGKIVVESYDSALTSTTQEELNTAIKNMKGRNNIEKMIENLDPEFSSTFNTLNTHNAEDANTVIDYFKGKVNKSIPKEKLLDAVIKVKKSIYLNFNDQDFEDMKMGYSLTQPFAKSKYENGFFKEFESLYGEQKYNEYLEKRYNEIKSETREDAIKNNPCLHIAQVLNYKKTKELIDDKIPESNYSGNSLYITDKSAINLLKSKAKQIQEAGFKISGSTLDDDLQTLRVTFPTTSQENISIEDEIESLKQSKQKLYSILGLEKSQTQKLGEETLEEQNDTKGKIDVKSNMDRQLTEINRTQEDLIQ